jgi:hypothetical protein
MTATACHFLALLHHMQAVNQVGNINVINELQGSGKR